MIHRTAAAALAGLFTLAALGTAAGVAVATPAGASHVPGGGIVLIQDEKDGASTDGGKGGKGEKGGKDKKKWDGKKGGGKGKGKNGPA
ncbi:hypothetical protein ACLMAL_24050 [Nocardia sp. CWNU-33]|uniref:hypothetical protein n=1 Tax=Nocardia sp. CWNU-33 TaxID=3392117 RepID=UPI00398E980F